MTLRVKRTYKLAEETVRIVRELSADYGLAPTQDGVVDLAVHELARQVRDAREGERWEQAAADPAFRTEIRVLELEFADADAETWPR